MRFQVVFIGVHLPVYLKDNGLGPEVATAALALIGLFNVIGTYTAGALGQRLAKRYILAAIYALRGVAIVAFVTLRGGVDANPDKFIDAVNTKQPNIVALSALLTTTLPSMRNIVDKLTQAGVRDKVKVIVGGAPVTQDFADEIGADGYTDNAGAAVALARRLLGLN